jgi:hypothetical protein
MMTKGEELECLAPDEVQAKLEELIAAVQSGPIEPRKRQTGQELNGAYIDLGIQLTRALGAEMGFYGEDLLMGWVMTELEEIRTQLPNRAEIAYA